MQHGYLQCGRQASNKLMLDVALFRGKTREVADERKDELLVTGDRQSSNSEIEIVKTDKQV